METETSISVRGHIIYIVYDMTEDKAIQWWLNPEYHGDYVDPQIPGPGTELLETLLRIHEHELVEQRIIDDIQVREYHTSASPVGFVDDDIPF